MLKLVGVTDIEDRVAAVTVRVVLPDLPPKVAIMVGVPVVTAEARPLRLTVADVSEELHVTSVVISKLVPSEYAPEAANCWVSPTGMLELFGVTDMEDRVAAVTVRVVVPETVKGGTLLGMVKVAVMVVEPVATAVARPLLWLTVATDVFEETQVA